MPNHYKTSISFKYFSLMSMVFVTVSLCDLVAVLRNAQLGPFLVSGGTFIMPLYYYLSDAIAEVYGYQYIRQTTWMMFICCIIFSLLVTFVIHLPTPHSLSYIIHYNHTFEHLFRVTFGGTLVTILIGTFVNSYLISKWKILVKGKYFWMRSIGASAIGEALEVFLEVIILYASVMPMQEIIAMIIPTYIIHIVVGFIIIFPGALLVKILKLLEGKDVYDYSTSFNPFKFKIDEANSNIESVPSEVR